MLSMVIDIERVTELERKQRGKRNLIKQMSELVTTYNREGETLYT